MEERKRGRPIKFSKEYMVKMKAVYSGTRAGNRHIQNHFYQACSFPEIMKYHKEHSIENFEFLYKDEAHFKGKRQILMRSDIKLPQPFVSWSNSR